jgi:glycosyltransferase involved in cell wall biosynthesis
MKIGLDLRMLGGGSGIDRYITELSHEILKQDEKNQYVLFFRTADQSADYFKYNHKVVVANIAHYSFGEQFKFLKILERENLDLIHFPHFNVPIMYRKPFVVTIHDLTHTLFPGRKKSRIFHRIAYNMVFKSAIEKSKKIISVSESTKKQIIEHFGIDANKITVVYEGINSNYKMMDKQEAFEKVSNRFGISKPYILYVGEWRRYKNLPKLAAAFDKLIDKGLDLQLVLAGKPDPYYPKIKDQIFKIQHRDRIITPGRVSDEELNLLYNSAELFVLPSLMEGFGLTALEAASCGIPIACSDIPTLREIVGQAGVYFDPNNLDNMIDVMQGILEQPEKLEELANLALRRSTFFSWKKTAEETIQVYSSIL